VYSATLEVGRHQRRDGRAARLAQQQRRLRIDVDEHFFDGRAVGLVGGDDFATPSRITFRRGGRRPRPVLMVPDAM
jgi:hypothetical protein